MMRLRNVLILALALVVAIPCVAAFADYIYTDTGGNHTVFSWVCQTTKLCTTFSISDSGGANAVAVKAASTPAAQADPALVVRSADLGTPGDTACSSDIGSCAVNALLQRIAQRLSTLITAISNGIGATGSAVPADSIYSAGNAQSSEPAATTTGFLTGFFTDLAGKLVTSPYANRENMVRGSVTSTDTSAHTVIAAQGSGIKTYITDIELSRNDTGTGPITVTMNDSASTPFVIPNNGGGGGREIHLHVPLVTAANTAFTCTSGTNTTTVTCDAQGFKGY